MSVYREPGKVEPEPVKKRPFPWKETLPIVAPALFGTILTVLAGTFAASCEESARRERHQREQAAEAARKQQADGWSVRQKNAEAWMQRNGLDGKVTCYTNENRCDVVPKDARAPFKIMCGVDVCSLP